MADDASPLLNRTWEESGDILEGDERNVEGVAEADKPRRLHGCIDIERPGQAGRLVGHHAHGPAAKTGKPDQHVLREVLMHFEKVAVVDNRVDDLEHVVGLVRRDGHQGVQRLVGAVHRIARLHSRRIINVVTWQKREQFANQPQTVAVVIDHEVGDPALLVVRHRAAELLHRHLLVRHGADDIGAGHEHVARAAHHDGEVGDGRRVHGPAGARPHDGGDLRDDPGRKRVAQKDVGVARQRDDALLDARAPRVVETDDRGANLHRRLHDLHDLGGVGLRERSAEYREVLSERVDHAPLHPSMAGDDAIAGHETIGHAEITAAMGDETVNLREGAVIEEQIDPLPRRQLWGAHTFAACACSQSFRNFARPMSVSGCLKHCSMTAGGTVTTSAPIRADSTM